MNHAYSAYLEAGHFPGANGGERIQAALDQLGDLPKVISVGPDGPDAQGCWLLKQALRIPSNTTLLLNGARLFLADGANDNLLRNTHADSADERRNHDIHVAGLGGAELNGNARNQRRQSQVFRTMGISFHKVDRVSIKGIALGPTEAWGMGLEDISDLLVDGIRFQQDGSTHNQDGVHVSGPGRRVVVTNIIGTIADDAVAIDAGADVEDYRGSARGQGGRLEDVVVSNIAVKNMSAGAIVRTIASKGKPLDGVFISQVIIDGANQVLKIGWDRMGARRGGRDVGDVFPSCDEHKNIVIDGVKGSTPDVFLRIESNVKNLTVKNVRGSCGTAAVSNQCGAGGSYSMENVTLEDWVIDGCHSALDLGGEASVMRLTMRNAVFTAAPNTAGAAVRLSGAGQSFEAKRITLEHVDFSGFAEGVVIAQGVTLRGPLLCRDVDFEHALHKLHGHEGEVQFV